MKKIIFAFACALAFSTAASAQLIFTKDAPAGPIPGNSASVSVGFSTVKTSGVKDNGTEFAVAYSMPFAILESYPAFVDFSPELSYMNADDKYTELKKFAVNVPVSLGYAFVVTDDVLLAPYAGLAAKFNLMMKSGESNLLKNSMGGKFFQLGAQIGVKAYISRLNVGLGYAADITPAAKYELQSEGYNVELKSKINTFRVSIGYNF